MRVFLQQPPPLWCALRHTRACLGLAPISKHIAHCSGYNFDVLDGGAASCLAAYYRIPLLSKLEAQKTFIATIITSQDLLFPYRSQLED